MSILLLKKIRCFKPVLIIGKLIAFGRIRFAPVVTQTEAGSILSSAYSGNNNIKNISVIRHEDDLTYYHIVLFTQTFPGTDTLVLFDTANYTECSVVTDATSRNNTNMQFKRLLGN